MSKLAKLRREMGLTQKSMADKLDMTLSGYIAWEKKKTNQKMFERLAVLCKTLDCYPEDLVEGGND